MVTKQNTDKKLISQQKRRKDGSILAVSLAIALILAIGSGVYVHFKKEARKKQIPLRPVSYLMNHGTKTNPMILEVLHSESSYIKI